MGVLSNLEPVNVFKYFEDLCGIPHGSYNEKAVSDYCVAFAKERGLEHYQDELGNVIIIKEATPGYEEKEPLIIQGHLDMVCEKTADCDIDFMKDGLRLKVEGDLISAEGTTLGGDDGIAVAYALAVLDEKELKHPRLEIILTVSEETGMEGAYNIDLSPIRGHKLLNIDSEEEGIFLTSCAGGCRCEIDLPLELEEVKGMPFTVSVEGLAGGHSGAEIHKGRANANALVSGLICEVYDAINEKKPGSVRFVFQAGGTKDNVITQTCEGTLLLPSGEETETILDEVKEAYLKKIGELYKENDPKILFSFQEEEEQIVSAATAQCTEKVIRLIRDLPYGVVAMSKFIDGLVETSLNPGICDTEDDKFILRFSVRSSVASEKEKVVKRIEERALAAGASFDRAGDYPAWEYVENSALRTEITNVYREMYGKEPKLEAIHAGLECGLLSGKIPGLDAVSLGPDMWDIHSPKERLSIASTARVYEFLLKVISI